MDNCTVLLFFADVGFGAFVQDKFRDLSWKHFPACVYLSIVLDNAIIRKTLSGPIVYRPYHE